MVCWCAPQVGSGVIRCGISHPSAPQLSPSSGAVAPCQPRFPMKEELESKSWVTAPMGTQLPPSVGAPVT